MELSRVLVKQIAISIRVLVVFCLFWGVFHWVPSKKARVCDHMVRLPIVVWWVEIAVTYTFRVEADWLLSSSDCKKHNIMSTEQYSGTTKLPLVGVLHLVEGRIEHSSHYGIISQERLWPFKAKPTIAFSLWKVLPPGEAPSHCCDELVEGCLETRLVCHTSWGQPTGGCGHFVPYSILPVAPESVEGIKEKVWSGASWVWPSGLDVSLARRTNQRGRCVSPPRQRGWVSIPLVVFSVTTTPWREEVDPMCKVWSGPPSLQSKEAPRGHHDLSVPAPLWIQVETIYPHLEGTTAEEAVLYSAAFLNLQKGQITMWIYPLIPFWKYQTKTTNCAHIKQ